HRHRDVGVEGDHDLVAVPRQRLVEAVVDDLVDEVVQPAHVGRADVHTGAAPHRVEALEDLDLGGAVAVWSAARRGGGKSSATRGRRAGRRVWGEVVGTCAV